MFFYYVFIHRLKSYCLSACMLSCFSCVQLCEILWNVACQAPLSMGFSRQESWSGLPPLGDLPDPGTQPNSLRSSALVGRFFTTSATWEALMLVQRTERNFSLLEKAFIKQFDSCMNPLVWRCFYGSMTQSSLCWYLNRVYIFQGTTSSIELGLSYINEIPLCKI